ncbi:thioesterase-like superfamily-domain-containing protein [Aspergillus heterothallicus]
MSAAEAQSTIAKQIDVIRCPEHGPDVFTNTSQLWRPGARGIFGGFAIAQSLRAAQQTMREEFVAHSLHGSFVYAGNSDIPIFYHVERVRDGRGFCTRSVRAIQGGRPVFISVISFARKGLLTDGNPENLQHSVPIPAGIPEPAEGYTETDISHLPFINSSVGVLASGNRDGAEETRIHQWIRASGSLPPTASHHIHQAALAFMSDSYFLAAVPHSHGIWHFVNTPVSEFYPSAKGLSAGSEMHTTIRRPHLETPGVERNDGERRISIMVSLDHTMYFHNVDLLRADEWLLSEVQSSWAGDERGLVQQRMWTKDGKLVATCIQEGVIRLQNGQEKAHKTSHL